MSTAQDQQSRAELSDFEAWYAKQCMRSDDAKQGLIRAWAHLAWKAARAMPAGVEPVARVCQGATANIEWRKGMTYADLPAIDGQDLYTAAQVLAMGRVPPGWQAVPVEPTREMVEAGVEDLRLRGYKHALIVGALEAWRAMLAAAPRPPAAPQDDRLRHAVQAALDLLVYVKKAPRDAGYIDWQAGVVEQQLLEALEGVPAAQEGQSNG